MKVEEVRQELMRLADEDYKAFHSRLLPGTENILGVRVPELRKLAKRMVKEAWTDYFDAAPSMYYEEDMLRGLMLGYAKLSPEERLKRIAQFVPSIKNWAVCD